MADIFLLTLCLLKKEKFVVLEKKHLSGSKGYLTPLLTACSIRLLH